MKNLILEKSNRCPLTHGKIEIKPENAERRILKKAARASIEFKLIEPADRILVALSGGKDSWSLLHSLIRLRQRTPFSFEIHTVVVHPGFQGFRTDIIEDKLKNLEIDGYEIIHTPIYEIVKLKNQRNKIFCSLCSRLRRGVLYSCADRGRFNKIALGHHMDDVIETLLLNVLFEGKISAMSPRRTSDSGKHIIIRPLFYVEEKETASLAYGFGYPVICCMCPLCYEKYSSKRLMVKELIKNLESAHPGIKKSLLASLRNIDPKGLIWFLQNEREKYTARTSTVQTTQ